MAERVRVMFLAANPFLDLKINDEVRDIRARIRESVFRNADLVYEPATRAGDLIGRLDETRPHIVHFSGHGTESHELILLDDRGAPSTVHRDHLAELFRLCRDNLRIVFLNFCHSLPIAEEIRGVVDCVIGTTDAIPDQAARFFAAQFYGSLSSGRTVLEAFDRATLQLKLQQIPGGEVLRLLHADDVDPGQLRLVEPPEVPIGDDGPVEDEHTPGPPGGTGMGPRRDARGRGRSPVAPEYAWRWIESNSGLITVAILALTIAVITLAAVGLTAVGIAVLAIDVAAAGGWIAYRSAARRREAGKLGETAKRNVVDRPGFFRVRPYDDTPEDQQLFDRADGAHEEVLRWLRGSDRPILFLSGLSGTGKSSLLHAYALPRLRGGPAPGSPSRDVVSASPAARPAPSPPGAVVLRNYEDPMGLLASELRKLGDPGRRPTDPEDPRESIRHASGRCGGRLLIVLDQYEQLLIAQEGNAQRFEDFVGLLRSLGREPIPGVTALITLRGDYLGFLDEQRLGTVTLNENLKIIKAFRPQDSRAFLARSGLRIEPELLLRVVDELAEVEQTEGLIRPITLNMLGLALSHRSPGEVATLPPVEEVLTDYCRACISRPAIGPYAPAVLRPMISRVETIQPRTVAELARRTKLRPAIIRGVLLNLGNDGLVRRVDASEDLWEVSHDFVAHLLAGLLRRFQALKVGLPLAAAAVLLLGLSVSLLSGEGDATPANGDVGVTGPDRTNGTDRTVAGASTGSGSREDREDVDEGPGPVEPIAARVLGRDEDPRATIPWLWENGKTLKICFLDGDPKVHEAVEQYSVEWTEHANLTFEFVDRADSESADIRITCPPNRQFQSFLGTGARTLPEQLPSMTLGFTPDVLESPDEVRRLVLHQFGHALGLINEHQNPNCRETLLTFKSPEVFEYYRSTLGWDRETVTSQILDNARLQAYRACDPESIMMDAFPAAIAGRATSVHFELSEGDKAFVRRLYPPDLPDEAASIPIGETLTARLAIPGFKVPFRFVIESDGLYAIETVTPEGASDHPWSLSLFDGQMNFIANDEQASGQGTNARINKELQKGTYILSIESRLPSGTGEFGIIVRPASRVEPFRDVLLTFLIQERERLINPTVEDDVQLRADLREDDVHLRAGLRDAARRRIADALDLPDPSSLSSSDVAYAETLVNEVLAGHDRP